VSSPTKTIELRGGPASGTRLAVPMESTGASVPTPEGLGVYRQSADRTDDGAEIWDEIESWTASGMMPL
jgi:hypothetical protein